MRLNSGDVVCEVMERTPPAFFAGVLGGDFNGHVLFCKNSPHPLDDKGLDENFRI